MGRALLSKLSKLASILSILSPITAVLPDENVKSGGAAEVGKESWEKVVKENPYLLVLFYENGCPPCLHALSVLTEIAEPEIFPGELKKVKSVDAELAAKYQISHFPTFALFRQDIPVLYDGETVEADQLAAWLQIAHQDGTQILNDDSFEHLTQAATGATTGDWLAVFYQASCNSVLPAVESFAVRVKGKMNVAKVDMDSSPKTVKRFKIDKCPTSIFFRQKKMYRYDVGKYDTKSLTSFVEGWYKNSKAETVPVEISAFDELTEGIAMTLKKHLQGPRRVLILGIAGGAAVLLVLITVIMCVKSHSSSKRKMS